MATVEFNCPQCGQICAFQDRFVGRRARCTKCNAFFFIPAAGQPARALKPAIVDDGPFSGFWTALLKDTPKALLNPNSLASLAILVFLSALRFYLGHPMLVIFIPFFLFIIPVPVGIFVTVLTSLSQCRYLFNIIQSTAGGSNPLPDYLDGTYIDRFFDAIVSTYSLFVLIAAIFWPAGLTFFGLIQADLHIHWPVAIAAALGLLFLPLSMTIYAYSRDLFLSLRPDYILSAARRAFWPHLAIYAMTLAIAALFWRFPLYALKAPPETIPSGAVIHILTTMLIILAARTAGLFYRHYGCYLP